MSDQVQHTQGPWSVGHGSGITGPRAAAIYLSMNGVRYEVIRKDDRLVAVVPHGEGDALEDARRIVAAVNAVEGISTEALKIGVVREMAELLCTVSFLYGDYADAPEQLHQKMGDVVARIDELPETTFASLWDDADAS